MKADNTRNTFNQDQHYNRLLMQQGRVQTDADWNEQVDIAAHRVETETIDVIGSCGGPMDGAGFAFKPQGNKLQITAGRYYVDGILCENEAAVLASAQPDLPPNAAIVKVSANSTLPFSPPTAGVYIAYMDVWSRHITALNDPVIREVALGGPDTATRSKTIWQIQFLKVGNPGDSIDCLDSFPSWDNLIAAPDGKLAARTAPDNPDPNPCIVAPGAGFRRLENELYRVEIHKPGATGTATFKWSRDNGSIVTSWLGKTNDELTVSSIGRDKVLNFTSGQWVELSDDTRDLMGQPGTLVRLVKAEGNVLTIDPATATGSVNFADFPLNPKVRRWDSDGEMDVEVPGTNQGWIALEDGVQIKFKTSAQYRSGDYWLIPARTATADVEWPKDGANNPLSLPPKGIEHHYCRLAVVQFDGTNWSVLGDCRCLFPSLTQANSLYYVSGDGQEVMPDLTAPANLVKLPQPLVVGVVNPQCRNQPAKVRFKVLIGDGKVIQHGGGVPTVKTIEILTDDAGLASCDWSLDGNPSNWSQQVEATLLDADNNPIHLPIRFNANLSIADQVAYDPKQCGALAANPKTVTVQQAIDRVVALASLYPASETNFTLLANQAGNFQLRVVASSKCGPVSGMQVTFRVVTAGGGVLSPSTPVTTDVNGLAACSWTLGVAAGTNVVEAELQANASHPTVPPTIVRFTAQRAAADDPGFHVTGLFLDADIPNPSPPPLRNDMTVPVSQFQNGLQIDCDAKVDRTSISEKPVVFVTLEIPFFELLSPSAGRTMVGFQPVILDGSVKFGTTINASGFVSPDSDPQKIVWTPTKEAADWIQRLLASLKDTKVVRLLARLTAMGNFIWEEGRPDIYLDGEVFGLLSENRPFGLRLPASGDGKRGGDLKMWFWIGPVPKTKENKEIKDIEKTGDKVLKDIDVKPGDFPKTGDGPSPVIGRPLNDSAVPDIDSAAVGRSFIQPEERPAVDATVFDEPLQGSSS